MASQLRLPRWCSGTKSAANAGDTRDSGSIPGLGRSPGEGNDKPLQYSCLENSMDRGVWWATVHGVAKNRTQLNNFIFTFTETLTTNQAVLEAVDTTDTPIQRKDIQTRKREQSTINAIGEHTMGAQKEKHLIGRRGFHKWCH